MRHVRPCVYIMASGVRGTSYVGVTSNFEVRAAQHRLALVAGFTSKYRIDTLVWFEAHGTMESAILREKSVKAWKRAWKLALVENANPEWRDLFPDLA
jgi:putative endonuclease